MNKQKSKKQIRIIEGALLIALCITLCTGLWARAQQQKLSGELVRLHVIAASDSDADQALKLRIRDRALMHLTPLLDRAQSVDDARAVIESELPHLEKLANDEIAAAGFDYSAAAALSPERYPTREYMGFALPAGSYLSLRITLGGGEGQNWWCVAFPTLCVPATSEGFEDVAAGAGFPDRLNEALKDLESCSIRFFLLDCMGRVENFFHRG